MQSPSVALPLVALLLWADSLPYCTDLLYRPAMLKTSQILAPTKYWRRPKIHPILSGLRQTFLMILTLSQAAPLAPPCLEALGLIGPRKKGEKLVLMTSARSDWT
jgi:hypothetical protein